MDNNCCARNRRFIGRSRENILFLMDISVLFPTFTSPTVGGTTCNRVYTLHAMKRVQSINKCDQLVNGRRKIKNCNWQATKQLHWKIL